MPGPGDDLLAEFDSLAEESGPRMRQTRRTVLPEVRIEGSPEGDGRVRMSGRGRVELGDEVDANSRIAAVDPRVTVLPEQRIQGDPERVRRLELRDEMSQQGALAPVWDALLGAAPGTGEAGDRAASRSRERLPNFWDPDPARGARPGGRNTLEPIIGPDPRPNAAFRAAADAATLGFADEMGGALRSALTGETYRGSRDRLREHAAQAREQAPEASALGDVAGTLPLMAIPGASQASATIGLPARLALATGQGAQLGAMAGFGHSEGDLVESPERVAQDTLQGGVIGGASGFLGEGIGRVLEGPGRAPQIRERALRELAEGRDDALLAATTSAGRGQTAIQRFDRGATPRAIRQSRSQAAQTLRETGAVPTLGSVRDVSRSVDDALGRTTRVMDDVRSAMDGDGPTYQQVADALRARAGREQGVFSAPLRDVLEARADDFAARGARPLGYEQLIDEAARLRQMGAGQTRAGQTPSMQREALDEIDSVMRDAYDRPLNRRSRLPRVKRTNRLAGTMGRYSVPG